MEEEESRKTRINKGTEEIEGNGIKKGENIQISGKEIKERE